MAGVASQVEWYVARDGAQHGPISDVEMRKFVELGHLRANDLVWCAGFPDWIPGGQVFPELLAPRLAPAPAAPAAPAQPTGYAPSGYAQPQQHQATPVQQAAAPAAEQTYGRSYAPTVEEPVAVRPQVDDRAAARGAPAKRTRLPQNEQAQFFEPHGHRAPEPDGRVDRSTTLSATDAGNDHADDEADLPKRSWLNRVAALVAVALIVGGVGWIGWQNRSAFSSVSTIGTAVLTTISSGPSVEHYRTALYVAPGDTKDEIDASLQKIAIWRYLKRDYADWYTERLADVERMRGQKQDERVISKFLADVIVVLRRRNAAFALQSSPDHLKKMAGGFLANLKQLASRDASSCYNFISFGEANPFMLELTKTAAFSEMVQRQMLSIYDAIADGRERKMVHPSTRRTDYDVLTAELTARGWTQADLAIFSDPQRLSSSLPEKVCGMVQDWFSAQLALKDAELQARLLAESLKPLVFG